MSPSWRASAPVGILTGAAAVGLFLLVAFSSSGGKQRSLLQDEGRQGVAERMVRFGQDLEAEGVVSAGKNLIREGQELEEQSMHSNNHFGARQSRLRRSMSIHSHARRARNDGWMQDTEAVVPAPYSSEQKRGRWTHQTLQEVPVEEQQMGDEEGQAHLGYRQVATGKRGTYDGFFGEQYKRNAGGNEEKFRKAGINYDDYPADIYKGVPWFTFDPAVMHVKELNQKIFEPKDVEKGYDYTSGRKAGEHTWPAGWGAWPEGSPEGDRLRAAGVKVDQWPVDMVKGFPLPAWDKAEYDTDKYMAIAQPKDAEERIERDMDSKAQLLQAGVQTDGLPMGDGKHHAYNTVDGLLDTLVTQDPVPKYRDQGVARQEQPFHFLLKNNPNGEAQNQMDSIENVYSSGELDRKPQVQENSAEGYEFDPDEQ